MPQSSDPIEAFAITAPGLSRITAGELAAMGIAVDDVSAAGVTFKGGLREVYAANLHLRTASRVIVRLARFQARTFAELERHAAKIPWAKFIAPGRPFRIRVTSRKSRLYHSDAVAERVARAIRDGTGGEHSEGEAAEEHEGEGAQLVVVRLERDECTVNMDSSGALLHMRGYRRAVAKAPMRETIAAAMLLAAEWKPDEPLFDPFCGSGTIPIEGAMLAKRIAPGLGRVFSFQQWPWIDAGLWSHMRREAESDVVEAAGLIIVGSDRDEGAIGAAAENSERAGVVGDIEWAVASVSEAHVDGAAGWIITNPPYGVRVGVSRELRNLYSRFGEVLRARFSGWSLAFLSADHALEAQLRMELEVLFRTTNGGIPVRCMRSPRSRGDGGS
ncbi:MAG TPA: class I SAM-dependent RNA methyltransferase [Gemmatimonadaceae bacterium]|nr:class I SAM-dependent RNA methyltransferase [Gemmatimonadaceae bacterium]